MSKIISGQKIAADILKLVKQKAAKLKKAGKAPKLAVILVGENPASEVYVRQKAKSAEKVGVNFELHRFLGSISRVDLILAIKKIQQKNKPNGLIVQLPLPEKLYCREVLNAIDHKLDVDFLTDFNLGSLITKSNVLEPPTSGAMMQILRSLKINLAGKRVVVIGAGVLVGRPLSILLLNQDATVTVCNNKTKNLAAICREADVILSCVGKNNLIRGKMIKPGAIVIDAGFSFVAGKAVGDVNFKEASKVASYLTPTPGGVGPITVANLLLNVVLAAENN